MMELLLERIVDLLERRTTFYRSEELGPLDPCFGWRSTTVITAKTQNVWWLISGENPTIISSGTRGSQYVEEGFETVSGWPDHFNLCAALRHRFGWAQVVRSLGSQRSDMGACKWFGLGLRDRALGVCYLGI